MNILGRCYRYNVQGFKYMHVIFIIDGNTQLF